MGFSVLFLPAGSDGLPLGVELNGTLSVEVSGSPHGGLVSGEGEHGKGDGDGEVDTDLTGLNLVLELAGDMAVLGEDGGTVTPLVGVHEVDTFLEGVDTDDAHDGSEDLLVVGSHAGLAVIDDGGTDEVAVGVSLNLGVASVEKELSLLLTVGNEVLNLLEVLLVVDGADVGVLVAGADSETLGLLNNLGNPVLGISDEDNDGGGHAALTGGAESGTDQGVDGVVLVGVGHDEGVVLGSHVNLVAFAVLGGESVDVLTSGVGTNERDSLDVLMGADLVDSGDTTVDDVDDTIGDTRLLEEVDEDLNGVGDLLGRLEDEGVSADNGHGVHPEGDHSGEVVGGNTGNNTEGNSVGVNINSGGDTLHGLTLEEGSGRARVLNDLVASEDVTLGVSGGLAVLLNDSIDKLVLVSLEQVLVLEHLSHLLGNGNVLPGLESILGVSDGFVEFLLS